MDEVYLFEHSFIYRYVFDMTKSVIRMIIFLNNINGSVFLRETHCDFCAVRTEYLNAI
jgi:hypothetical protein